MSHPQRTPAGVITAGVILTIYGALLLFCGICGGIILLAQGADADLLAGKNIPGYTASKIVGPASNFLVAISAIVAGICCFQLIAFGRILAYLVSAYQIFFLLCQYMYQLIFVFPPMQEILAQQAQNQPPAPFDITMIFKGAMWVGVVIGVLLHLAFLLPPVHLLSTRSARNAFAGISGPGGRDDYEHRPRLDGYDDDDDYRGRRTPPKFPGDTGIQGHD